MEETGKRTRSAAPDTLLHITIAVGPRFFRRVGFGFLVLLGVTIPFWLFASTVTLPYTFSNGTVADANQVNANFSALKSAIDANAAQNAHL